ncbi:MAG: lysozyme inhibitor LprI family protein [Paracoccaceae bacterium]
MKCILAAVLLSIPAAPAAAQDFLFSPGATEECLKIAGSADERRQCIGLSANRCMEDSVGGHSTYGMGACTELERRYWDERLNARYRILLDRDSSTDAETAELGLAAPSLVENLRAMQRAWISYRDAKCGYEMAQWGGGTGQGPALLGCLMRLTALQTLYLEERLEER